MTVDLPVGGSDGNTLTMLEVAVSNPSVQTLADLGYNILVFAVIIAGAWVLGRVIGMLAGRVVARGGGDSLLRQTVVGRALLRSGQTASSFADAVTRLVIYVVGFLFALESLKISFVTDSVAAFLAYLPSLVGAAIIFMVGIIFADWIGELTKKSVSPEIGEVIYVSLIGDAVKIILYFVTITIALRHLDVDVTILYIIAQAFAWGAAISMAIATGIIVGWLLRDRIKNWLPSHLKD